MTPWKTWWSFPPSRSRRRPRSRRPWPGPQRPSPARVRELAGSGPTCDCWMLVTRGIPTICGYGVAGGGVHGADERVDLDSLLRLTQIYAQAMIHYFGPEEQSA